eukprot:SAG31_NODE_62_length_28678_cov_21.548270_19_plen_101_part_00
MTVSGARCRAEPLPLRLRLRLRLPLLLLLGTSCLAGAAAAGSVATLIYGANESDCRAGGGVVARMMAVPPRGGVICAPPCNGSASRLGGHSSLCPSPATR